jgi:hypothetical protein
MILSIVIALGPSDADEGELAAGCRGEAAGQSGRCDRIDQIELLALNAFVVCHRSQGSYAK